MEFVKLKLPVSKFCFSEKHKVIFLGFESKSVKTKLSNFFSVFSLSEKANAAAEHGGVGCYIQINRRLDYHQLWRVKKPHGVCQMVWNESLSILAVGLTNGDVICYGVWPEKNFEQFDEVRLRTDFSTAW